MLMLAFVIVAIAANAQKGKVLTFAAVDTINGNETIYFTSPKFTGNDVVLVQALCTEVGGTSDGTLTLEGSVDGTSFVPLTNETGVIKGYPNDSLTITDGAVTQWLVNTNAWYKLRIKAAGTASDSTLITSKYIRK